MLSLECVLMYEGMGQLQEQVVGGVQQGLLPTVAVQGLYTSIYTTS